MFFRTCVVGWELGKEGGGDRATVPQKSASPWHSLCTPIAMELGRVISFHCHGRNVSFSWILEKKSLWFSRSSRRVQGTEEFLNDLVQVEERECHIEGGQRHLLEATHGQNGPNASPGGGAWDFRFLEGTELGRGTIKFMLERQLRKSDPPDSFFPSSPFLRKGRVLKIQNCLPWSKRITSDKSGLPCDLCANNNTEHLLSTLIFAIHWNVLCAWIISFIVTAPLLSIIILI